MKQVEIHPIAQQLIDFCEGADNRLSDRLEYVQHENGTDLGPAFDSIVKNLNIEKIKYLGKGTYGCAFDIGKNVVLKITADDREIKIASKLQGKKLEQVAEYYKVYKSKSTHIGIILLKKYEPLPKSFINDYHLDRYKSFLIFRFGQHFDENITKEYLLTKIKEKLSDLMEMTDVHDKMKKFILFCNALIDQVKPTKWMTKDKIKLMLYYIFYKELDLYEFLGLDSYKVQFLIDVITAVKSLSDFGIDWQDYHLGNFAMDGDRVTAIDIGFSESDGGEGQIMTLENVMRRTNYV